MRTHELHKLSGNTTLAIANNKGIYVLKWSNVKHSTQERSGSNKKGGGLSSACNKISLMHLAYRVLLLGF